MAKRAVRSVNATHHGSLTVIRPKPDRLETTPAIRVPTLHPSQLSSGSQNMQTFYAAAVRIASGIARAVLVSSLLAVLLLLFAVAVVARGRYALEPQPLRRARNKWLRHQDQLRFPGRGRGVRVTCRRRRSRRSGIRVVASVQARRQRRRRRAHESARAGRLERADRYDGGHRLGRSGQRPTAKC